MGKLTISMTMFNSYVKLPEGISLVNIKIAGNWMFIPLKMVLIGIDPYPYPHYNPVVYPHLSILREWKPSRHWKTPRHGCAAPSDHFAGLLEQFSMCKIPWMVLGCSKSWTWSWKKSRKLRRILMFDQWSSRKIRNGVVFLIETDACLWLFRGSTIF